VYQGDDLFLTVRVVDLETGDPVDITTMTAQAQIRATVGAVDVLAEFVTIVGADGEVQLHLPNTVTATLPPDGGVWDVQLIDPDDVVTTLAYGEVRVTEEVTR
jgi:hypothetical protein